LTTGLALFCAIKRRKKHSNQAGGGRNSLELHQIDKSSRKNSTKVPENVPPVLLSTFIIKYSKLVVKDKIGSGAFGDVYMYVS
jgi:hypothetical protein